MSTISNVFALCHGVIDRFSTVQGFITKIRYRTLPTRSTCKRYFGNGAQQSFDCNICIRTHAL